MQIPQSQLAVTIRFRDGSKLDLDGVMTAGAESGCYNVVHGDRNGPTTICRYPLDLIASVEETVVPKRPDPADRLFVPGVKKP